MDTIVTPVTVITLDSTRIVHSIKADLVARYFPPVVRLVQYDQSLPVIAVSLMQNGQAYTLPSGAAANIRVHKPDATYVYNPALGCDSTRNIVYFEVTQAMAAANGDGLAIVEIVVDGDIAGTSLITLHFEENPVPEDAIESSDEWETIYELGERIIASTVTPVSTAAGMIDHNVVYLYTGTESGWNQGHMYYYNGTTWVDAGIAVTDTTLSVAGLAADAKKTGDEIADLKDGLSDLEAQIIATLITDTASGAIASFPDGADGVPVKSLTVDIEPVQDLHGQANPYPAGGGVNKLPPITAKQSASNGVTFKSNGDGTYSITGTASAGTTLDLTFDTPVSLSAGTYYVSFFNTAASGTIGFYAIGTSRNNLWDTTLGTANRTFTNTNIGNDSITALRCYVASGVNANVTLSPVVAVNAYSATFAPYENICPISGHTSATVTRTGANVWDEVWEVGGINQDGTDAPANDIIRSKNYIPVAPNTAYYCSYGNADMIYECFFYGSDKSHISNAVLPSTGVVTTPSNCGYMRFRCRASYGATYKNDLSINYPATVTTYNAYNGQTVTIDLDGTRYGGSLDVGTGVLTVDRALVSITSVQGKANTSANKEYYFTGVQNAIDATKSIISDKYPYNASPNVIYNTNIKAVGVADNGIILLGLGADGPSDMASANTFLSNNPITVCYFLKTPQTVQLSANEISTVLGQNNIWNDCGDTTVEYRADTKLYINKMLNA